MSLTSYRELRSQPSVWSLTACLIFLALPACSNAGENALPLEQCLPGIYHEPLHACSSVGSQAPDLAVKDQQDCQRGDIMALYADGTMREGTIYLSESARVVQTPQMVLEGTWKLQGGKVFFVRAVGKPGAETSWEDAAVCTESELILNGAEHHARLLPPREQAARTSLQTNAVVEF